MEDEMYAVSGETLTGIANAIRSKTGSDDFMTVASMAVAIEGISGGGAGGITLSPIEYDVVSAERWTSISTSALNSNYSRCSVPLDISDYEYIGFVGNLNAAYSFVSPDSSPFIAPFNAPHYDDEHRSFVILDVHKFNSIVFSWSVSKVNPPKLFKIMGNIIFE